LKEAELRPALQVAVREELFYQRGTPPEATYLFKHALIRDAAYQSMLRATRQRHHRRVAETLIERLHAVAAAQPELVAYHWTEAGEAEHAIEWWIRSAERASARADYTGAIAHTRHGLAVLPLLPDAEPRAGAELALQVLLGLASAASLGYAHPTTHEAFERACELCDPDRDPERATLIRYYLGAWNLSSGEYRRALDLYQTCVEVGERSGNANLEAIGFHGSASVFLHQGRAREAIAAFERTASLLDPGPFWLGQVEIQHRIRSWCAWAEWLAGFADRSRESVRVALEYARADGHPFSVCTATTWAAVAALYRRDWKEARRLGAESVRMGDEQGFPLLSAIGTFAEAPAALLGDGDETAIDRYGRAIQSAGSTGNRSNASVIVGNFGQLLTEVGRLDEATELVERALSIARSIDEGFYLAELHRFKGEIARRRDSEQEADALFREAIDIARGQEAKSLELRAATSLARLWQRQGKRAEARSLLQPVYGWFTEGFDTRDLVEARALLQELGP
jgi:tetratricopeptide (TPR) repeat protein